MQNEAVSKALSSHSISINYKKGQEIFLEDTPAKGVYCIQTGKAKLFKKCLERNLTIGLMGNGDLMGYGALFTGGDYTHSAKCLEDSQICFIPKKTFLSVITSNSENLLGLVEKSCMENHKMSNMLRDLKCKNTLSRVVCAIMLLTEKYGYDENRCLNISLTRKEISELAGTTTESAIRILNDLKKEKLIQFYNNRIRILDMSRFLRYK
jgi:CRP/FNR family transcriptional regulator